jgi:hypothetical protein
VEWIYLFSLFVWCMHSTERTIFAELHFIRSILLVFGRRVITTFASTTCKCHYISH